MTKQAEPTKIRCDFSNKALYNPVYIPLFTDESEFLHLFGSAGSGKSRFQAQKEIALSFDSNRRGNKTLVIRKIGNTLKDSVYTELETVIHEWNLSKFFSCLKSPLSITNKITGVTFIFKGLDDPEKIKSISKVDRAWIEEATELETRAELDQLALRLRGFQKKQITLSYNPIDEHHWLNTEIHQIRPPEHRIFKSTYKDNVRMLAKDPTYAPMIERLKDTNPNYYRVYGLGEWGQVVEGLIYDSYQTGVTFPEDLPIVYGLDFGHTDPHALVEIAVEDASPKKKLHVREILYQSNLEATELVAKLNQLGVKKDVVMTADSARPEMIASLKKAGFNCVGCIKGAGSVLSGINRVRDYQLCIAAGSKNIVKEIQNYQKKNKYGKWLEEPADYQMDHLLDAIRYGEQAITKQPWAVTTRSIR